MRTTLDIDDDLLAAARDLAHAEGKSLGAVVSELMRRAMTEPRDTAGFRDAHATTGPWPVLPDRRGVIVGPSAIAAVKGAKARDLVVA